MNGEQGKYALIHSDLRWISLDAGTKFQNSRAAAFDSAFKELHDLASGRTLVVPTYDYSFTASGQFDMRKKTTDLGALSKEVLNRQEWQREPTPVFSHSAFEESITPTRTPFSANSFFALLQNSDSRIYLLGVDVSRMTFIHYVESRNAIPYRYQKTFSGSVVSNEFKFDTSVSFHVRPKSGIVSYDFLKLASSLINAKVMKVIGSRSTVLVPSDALEFISSRLEEDPLWLLSPSSKKLVEAKLELLGRPFEINDFE